MNSVISNSVSKFTCFNFSNVYFFIVNKCDLLDDFFIEQSVCFLNDVDYSEYYLISTSGTKLRCVYKRFLLKVLIKPIINVNYRNFAKHLRIGNIWGF